ncbi:alpha/beta hydrolase [Pleurocapsa sp. PCC 7319]|uniref:alpha/beta hydrolase n=1 Tax=Pleurocapsa sp. PCC 7319 TaxID=118161 RepID=UPI000349F208|nr:alpha/beta hydrolase [Pleurocapsa sp. PCC 7319]
MKIKYFITPVYISYTFITISIILSALAVKSQPAIAAEKIKLIYGPFNGRISVESLKKYADTGEMTREFRLYSKFLDRKTLAKLRYWLGYRFNSDRVELYKYTNTSEGEKFLQELGTVIKTHPERNGFYAIRSALIEAADIPDNSDGWTIIEAMHQFPTDDLQINTRDLFKLQRFWSESEGRNKPDLTVLGAKNQE